MRLVLCLVLWLCGGAMACSAGAVAHSDPSSNTFGVRSASGLTLGQAPFLGSYLGCMAVVIDARTALTAAHCVQGHQAGDDTFVLGPDLANPVRVIAVTKIIVHPSYDGARANDLALLVLGIDAQVPAATVIDALKDTFVGYPLSALGYGASVAGGRGPTTRAQTLSWNVARLQTQSIVLNLAAPPCFGDNAAPILYQDPAGALFLVGIGSSTSTPDCQGALAAVRLDTQLGFLQVTPKTPALFEPSVPQLVAQDDCGQETSTGRCQNDTLIYCQSNRVQTQDCTANGNHCVWSFADQFYTCDAAQKGVVASSCAGESVQGRCDDHTLVYCLDGGTVQREDCTVSGKQCGYDLRLGTNACLAPMLRR